MSDQSTEVQLALLAAGYKALHQEVEEAEIRADKKIAAVESELAALRAERDKALRWGVLSLGGAVAGMAAFIWKHVPWGAS